MSREAKQALLPTEPAPSRLSELRAILSDECFPDAWGEDCCSFLMTKNGDILSRQFSFACAYLSCFCCLCTPPKDAKESVRKERIHDIQAGTFINYLVCRMITNPACCIPDKVYRGYEACSLYRDATKYNQANPDAKLTTEPFNNCCDGDTLKKYKKEGINAFRKTLAQNYGATAAAPAQGAAPISPPTDSLSMRSS